MAHELFYVDEDGQEQDASLHEELLSEEFADALTQRQSMEAARARGVDWKALHRLYPKAFLPRPPITP